MCPVRFVTYVLDNSNNNLQAKAKRSSAHCSGNCSGCAHFPVVFYTGSLASLWPALHLATFDADVDLRVKQPPLGPP